MTNLSALASFNFSSLCDDAENCLCWLIILLDIFAIFYLVFCSFYRVTKFVRMVGWMWNGVLITADVIIVYLHPCILTLLCVLFTIMIMTAILSVVLPRTAEDEPSSEQGKSKPKKEGKLGSYVVREVGRNHYCFEIYDKQDKFLVRSFKCYKTVDEAKKDILVTIESGTIAGLEDRTVRWIKETEHPKFQMYVEHEKYFFKLTANETKILFKSDPFSRLSECKATLQKTMDAVKTTAIYMSEERLSCDVFEQYYGDTEDDIEEKIDKTMYERKPLFEIPEEFLVEQAKQPKQEIAEEKPKTIDAANGAVTINLTEKKTLWESYEELPKQQKQYFDKLNKAAEEKEGSRKFESSSQLSFVVFRDKLMKLQIKRNVVEAIFMLMDPTFKQIENAKDIKLKETKTVIRIENDSYFDLALKTLDKKHESLMEQKQEREKQKKEDRKEKAKLKRQEQDGKK